MRPLEFVFSRIVDGHRHHRHCIHNLSYEEQVELRLSRLGGKTWTLEDAERLGLLRHIVVITPDDWEIDVPDIEWE